MKINEPRASVATQKSNDYIRLMRLDKPIGILLLLWPTLWALWISAQGIPQSPILLIFISGVILMRTAGCIINDIADRDFDHKVKRTQDRPLTTRVIKVKHALILFGMLCLLCFGLVLLLNKLTIYLAAIGWFVALLYPFMKRITYWPQAFLGIAFAWGIPMAFAAQTNSIPLLAWWLFATTALWIIAYDTQYAMADREDDIQVGVKSTAILFAQYDRLIIASLQITVLISWLIMAHFLALGKSFYLGWSCALFLAIYQQILIYHRHPADCFRAFINNNWFGCVIFLGLLFSFN